MQLLLCHLLMKILSFDLEAKREWYLWSEVLTQEQWQHGFDINSRMSSMELWAAQGLSTPYMTFGDSTIKCLCQLKCQEMNALMLLSRWLKRLMNSLTRMTKQVLQSFGKNLEPILICMLVTSCSSLLSCTLKRFSMEEGQRCATSLKMRWTERNFGSKLIYLQLSSKILIPLQIMTDRQHFLEILKLTLIRTLDNGLTSIVLR